MVAVAGAVVVGGVDGDSGVVVVVVGGSGVVVVVALIVVRAFRLFANFLLHLNCSFCLSVVVVEVSADVGGGDCCALQLMHL